MSVSQLHREAKVSREAIDAAEAGTASEVTYARLEAWFDAFEEEVGVDAPPPQAGDPHMVTIRGTRGGDIDVVVSGPIENIEQLAATVERLLRNTEERKSQAEDDPK